MRPRTIGLDEIAIQASTGRRVSASSIRGHCKTLQGGWGLDVQQCRSEITGKALVEEGLVAQVVIPIRAAFSPWQS